MVIIVMSPELVFLACEVEGLALEESKATKGKEGEEDKENRVGKVGKVQPTLSSRVFLLFK